MGVVRKTGYSQGDLVNVLRALRNQCLSKPLLVIGTGVNTKLKITNTTEFMIDGKIYTKATAEIAYLAMNAALVNTGAATLCKLRIEISAAGTVTCVQGPVDAQGDKYPPRTAGLCTLGWVDVPVSFTFDTTSAGLTYTDGDPDLLPDALMAGGFSAGLES